MSLAATRCLSRLRAPAAALAAGRGARAGQASAPRLLASFAGARARGPAAATAAALARPSATARRAVEGVRTFAAPGQITPGLVESMRGKIEEALEARSVDVRDLTGDGRHVAISVVAEVFEGKNAVSRQRLVYKAIWQELQEVVHAVDRMETKTPKEAGLE